LDYLTESFTAEETQRLLDWYRERHGVGDLELAKFVEFLIDYYPAGIKRFRRFAVELSAPDKSGSTLPGNARILMYVYLYTTLHNDRGILYDIIACRANGASKAEVLDALRFGFITSGPMGINAVAERSRVYLDEWEDTPGRATIEWPREWANTVADTGIGLDGAQSGLSDVELASIRTWYEQTSGEVPNHAALAARLHPLGYKAMLLRSERVFTVLPRQMEPLFVLCQATYNVWPAIIRRATLHARGLGVTRHHIIQAIFLGCLDGVQWKLEPALDAITDVLDGWQD
jgi:alkylhydroperoxidase/carboxymuconolactone decarboxylase family protein YurZ